MSTIKMFVYGTLMKGYRNYDKYLDGHVLDIKRAHISGSMYHLPEKDCPAVVDGDGKIYGQVMTIQDRDGKVVKAVDELEKYFSGSEDIMYERKPKVIHYEDGTSEDLGVYIFVNEKYLNNHKVVPVNNGDWHEFKSR